MQILFPNETPEYSDRELTLAFPAMIDGERVECAHGLRLMRAPIASGRVSVLSSLIVCRRHGLIMAHGRHPEVRLSSRRAEML
ncbi:MAG: FIG00461530: hypothetical protein [uncultured Paraburkholderia sp.]|nr:MAG: FIG00461530: hypothetical protein [uncultured Paraburkholderia sp.]CAH2932981.1 MAG: FIG00461530: hypothetical protein [uncultured Paraburkholderia sp.]